ncbi:hypothetical protein QQF64_034182 [Cirrhinus molitorella]|uniref:ribonuclease H n=1 Tax=Cirrhinus molitorella TaxID=172907 RepID=A0ABR3MW01_9TELE
MERGCAGGQNQTLDQKDVDWELWYENTSTAKPGGIQVVVQNSQRIELFSELFYAPVIVNKTFRVKRMLDSGSMTCTVNEDTASRMLEENIITKEKELSEQVILIGCGGHQTHPKCAYKVEIEVYGIQYTVPILVIPGQKDDLILGSNVKKYLMHEMKGSNDYWRLTAQNCDMSESPDTSQFLDMMAGVTRWQGAEIPSKIRTVKLTQAVTLLARHEHLLWGRLPKNTLMSPGSTVIVEPTSSKSMPQNILVGQVITPMWGDGYIPMKIMNLSDQPVTLKRNCKLADVSPCVAVEDFTVFQNTSQVETMDHLAACLESNSKDFEEKLANVGLKGIDIDSCQVSHSTKQELVQLLVSYNDIFSKHALDCGEAKGFSHRIRLVDERPFRLPYRRVPPAHYQKLRQVLTEMENQGIIRKSTSEFASPSVMVWKKEGSLRICTDFRWLNARTLKDAHPLPHQSDCLASLGGNVFFSTMDLTSSFYNIPMHEEDKKYKAFITPLAYMNTIVCHKAYAIAPPHYEDDAEYICDLNFTQLLCYLDDLLVFAATEKEALSRLEVVFQRLCQHNLKLSPKKCHLLRTSVRLLGHVIEGGGVAVDPEKVDVISRMTKSDLMEDDGVTRSYSFGVTSELWSYSFQARGTWRPHNPDLDDCDDEAGVPVANLATPLTSFSIYCSESESSERRTAFGC